MVKPPSAAPSEVASERDVLLATKLHVPRPRPDLVPRPQLAERLDEGLARGLMLVCAPAGYGKTVLLADWARRGQQPVAWLSLDVGDNDPARFWRHGVAALDQCRPGLAERVGLLLGPPAPSSYEGLVTALINELATGPDADRALLVLDDYHLIDSAAVHESLGFLIEHRPPELHLVLASRSDPPLALARLRGRNQLAELRAAELRFTADEAAALLRQGAAESCVALPETAVVALAARTEGWAAGLQLAALSLRGQPDAAGFVAAFTGSHRFILDFLAEEVLEQQSDQVRTFLLETSVLERLSGELCDAVTGRPSSQALLEQVERAGLFLVPLDEVRGWWRYHHLFADLLRARLQQEQPGQAALLHRNAAAWYDDHEMADDAIRHAVAAGEMTWAARLIEQHFDELFYLRGEGVTVQRWLSALPGDLVRTRPRLLLAQALLAFYSGRTETEEPLLDAAEQAYASPAGEPFEPTVGRAGSMLVNVPALIAIRRGFLAQLRGDAEDTAAFASRALAESKEGEWLLSSTARRSLAVAEWLRGRADGSRARLRDQHCRVAGGRPAHFDRMAPLPARPGPAGPGPPRHGHPDLRAGAESRCSARPAAIADRQPRVCGPGRSGLPAERARPCPPVCHRGHRARTPVPPRDITGRRPGAAGVDTAGRRRSCGSAGSDRRSRAWLADHGRGAQPGPGAARAAAPGPG